MSRAVDAALAAFWDYRFAGRTLHDPVRMEAALRAAALCSTPQPNAAMLAQLSPSAPLHTNIL